MSGYSNNTIKPIKRQILTCLLCIGFFIGHLSQAISQFGKFDDVDFTSIQFKHLTSDQGLAHNRVHAAIMDTQGFMWFGTQDGLSRWDGFSTKNYYPRIGDSTAISGSLVTSLAVDKKGYLWAVSHQGDICQYDPEADLFTTFHYPAFENDIVITAEMELHIDMDNIIWIGTFDDGIIRLDPETKEFNQYNVEDNLSKDDDRVKKNSVLVIEEDPIDPNTMWLGTNNGLYSFDKTTKKAKAHSPTSISGGAPAVRGIYRDDSDNIWLATLGSGVARYIIPTREWEFYVPNKTMWEQKNFSVNFIHDLSFKSPTELWICSAEHGSGSFNLDTKEFAFFEASPTSPTSIKSNTSNKVYTDPNGTVWWMQSNYGVSYMEPSCQIFQFKSFDIPSSQSSWSRFLSDFTYDAKSNILYGVGHVKNGLFAIDHSKGHIKRIAHQGFEGQINQYNSVLWTSENEILVGGFNNINASYGEFIHSPLLRLDKDIQRLVPYRLDIFDSLRDKNVNYLLEDSNQTIWIATDDGYLFHFNPKSSTLDAYYLNVSNGTGINFLVEDQKRKQLFCASFNGIFSFKLDSKRFEILNGTEEYSSRGVAISHNEDYLWIGTRQLGVQCYDLNQHKLLSIDNYRNAPRTPVEKIFIDKQNRTWATTERGIFLLNPELNSFYDFGAKNGIPNDFFYSQGVHVLVDGTIIMGQQGGYYYFHPDGLDATLDSGPVLITDVLVNQKEILKKRDEFGQFDFTLPYHQNSISIGFSSISYCQQEKVIFKYKLDGLEQDWTVPISNTRMIRYPALAPGKYSFMVKKIGASDDQIEQMKIHITPPFWLSWVAYLIYGFLFLYAINWVFGIRLRRQKEKEELRLKISSDIHDDVGSLLASLSMQSEIMSMQREGEEKKALLDISHMGRDAMDRLRDIVWALDSRRDKFENLIDKMRHFLDSNLAQSKMTYSFNCSKIPKNDFIRPDVRQNIYLLFKEAITNLLKHSNGDNVVIDFEKSGNLLSLRVFDNGTQNKIQKTEGQGLSNMKMRAKRVNGSLQIDQSKGFEILVKVPLK